MPTTTRERTGRSSSRSTDSRSGSETRITAKNLNADERRFVERHADGLSQTTLRAKWTHSPQEHEDRSGQSLATRDPEVIKAWAKDRRAEPATVGRGDSDARPRTLRFDFPGYGGRRLEHIGWDDWLRTFKERDLVFIYQEHTRDGRPSNFFRLDNPKREEG